MLHLLLVGLLPFSFNQLENKTHRISKLLDSVFATHWQDSTHQPLLGTDAFSGETNPDNEHEIRLEYFPEPAEAEHEAADALIRSISAKTRPIPAHVLAQTETRPTQVIALHSTLTYGELTHEGIATCVQAIQELGNSDPHFHITYDDIFYDLGR